MRLPMPITIQRYPLPIAGGRGIVLEPEQWLDVPVTLVDSERYKTVTALLPYCSPITLWAGKAYESLGNWTRRQAEERLLEVLGPNLQDGIQARVTTPRPRPVPDVPKPPKTPVKA